MYQHCDNNYNVFANHGCDSAVIFVLYSIMYAALADNLFLLGFILVSDKAGGVHRRKCGHCYKLDGLQHLARGQMM